MSYDPLSKISSQSGAFTQSGDGFQQKLQQAIYGEQGWAHWEYDAEEWALFDRIDWQAAWRRYWLPNLIVLGCLFILGLWLMLFQSANILVLALFFLLVALILFGVRRYFYNEAKKRSQARQNRAQPHRVTFSKEGVWEAGTYFPLNEGMLHLRSVHMTSQPAVLHFHCQQRHIRQANEYDTLRVLVPRGHEEEAARLMERFRTEVIKAKKNTYNPPEPV